MSLLEKFEKALLMVLLIGLVTTAVLRLFGVWHGDPFIPYMVALGLLILEKQD